MRGFGAKELLNCYARGVFPMAEGREDPRIYLLDPDERGVLPLDGFHIPRSLRKTVRQDAFDVSMNLRFQDVVRGCAEPAPGREETWINDGILSLYSDLHTLGYAHSVECWDGSELVGGLYGVALGGAFFGESMFSRATDASKIALVHLVAHLLEDKFVLLDAQFHNPHLEQFGLVEIPRQDFKKLLKEALNIETEFYSNSGSSPEGRGASFTGSGAAQRITQMS